MTASQTKRNTGVSPYAFTEQGVAMLSGVLNSEKAIAMNIAIMRAFVEIRKVLLLESDLKTQLKELVNTMSNLTPFTTPWKIYWMKTRRKESGMTDRE